MSLRSETQTYVDTALPGQSSREREAIADRLVNSGAVYLDTGNTLCVRAEQQSAANLGTSHLTTRISSGALTLLAQLQELRDAGVTFKIHDDDGTHIEVIS